MINNPKSFKTSALNIGEISRITEEGSIHESQNRAFDIGKLLYESDK